MTNSKSAVILVEHYYKQDKIKEEDYKVWLLQPSAFPLPKVHLDNE